MSERRQRRTGSVHPRQDGTWCGQVDLGIRDGKRRRKTVYAKTEKAAQSAVKALIRQLDEHGDLPTSESTVEKWLTTWLTEFAQRRLKPNTFRSYKTAVNEHLIPTLGRIPMGKLSAAHVRGMHRSLTEDRGLSSTTARNAHRILSVALNDAMRDGVIARNVARLEKAPAKAVGARTSLDVDDAIKVMGSDKQARWMLALLTGCRQGERLGLRWSHVDLDVGKADLSWSLQRVSYAHGCKPACGRRPASCPQRRPGIPAGMENVPLAGNLVLMRPKTERSRRVVALVEPLRLALELHRDGQPPNPYDLVWTENSKPVDPRRDWQAWHDALEACKVPSVPLHAARHTTATLLMELGVDPRVITEMLGHSDVVVTRSYQHVSLALQREAGERLARRLELV